MVKQCGKLHVVVLSNVRHAEFCGKALTYTQKLPNGSFTLKTSRLNGAGAESVHQWQLLIYQQVSGWIMLEADCETCACCVEGLRASMYCACLLQEQSPPLPDCPACDVLHPCRWEFKARHFDSTMLFKMGKFYEMFEMDAHVGVEVLGLMYMKVGTSYSAIHSF